MKGFITKTIAILLLLALLAGIGYLIIYPKQDEIKLALAQLDIEKMARNTTLKLLTTISQPVDESTLIAMNKQAAMENITPEELAAYRNGGKVITALEPLGTTLSIPSADIKGKLYDGESSWTLLQGLWHFPLSTAPGERGNAVIISHRYQKIPPATDTFFNLDKVQVGDKIYIKQKNATYTYTVTQVKVTASNDRTILMPTTDYRITLITCTPLWTDLRRLVVIGKLDKVVQNI